MSGERLERWRHMEFTELLTELGDYASALQQAEGMLSLLRYRADIPWTDSSPAVPSPRRVEEVITQARAVLASSSPPEPTT